MITTNITDDLVVEVFIDGVLVDWPGPWATREAAQQWADAVVAAVEAGTPIYQQEPT